MRTGRRRVAATRGAPTLHQAWREGNLRPRGMRQTLPSGRILFEPPRDGSLRRRRPTDRVREGGSCRGHGANCGHEGCASKVVEGRCCERHHGARSLASAAAGEAKCPPIPIQSKERGRRYGIIVCKEGRQGGGTYRNDDDTTSRLGGKDHL